MGSPEDLSPNVYAWLIRIGPSMRDHYPDFYFHLYPSVGKDLRLPVAKLHSTSTAANSPQWNHWLRTCLDSHTACQPQEKWRKFVPKRLLRILAPQGKGKTSTDNLRWQLVFPEASRPVEYTTLSHCWGSHQPLSLTKKNITLLKSTSKVKTLPRTYMDALVISAALGYRYIWIDSLCIIQDDRADWLEQAPQMARVYGASRCNIAASWAEDSNQGCFHNRDPVMVTPTSVQVKSRMAEDSEAEYSVIPSYSYKRDIVNSALNKRGWVVQERWLSLRQLMFATDQAYWECCELVASEQYPQGIKAGQWHKISQTTSWNGDGLAETRQNPPAQSAPRLHLGSELDRRKAWCSLIEDYSSRQLTHSSDKTIAFASLAHEMKLSAGDDYLAGHWRKDLLYQLFWSTNPSASSSNGPDDVYHAPSWSWMAYHGAIIADQRYFSTALHAEVILAEVVDVWIHSKDPSSMHSFTSGALYVRGIAVPIESPIPSPRQMEDYISNLHTQIIFTSHPRTYTGPQLWDNLPHQLIVSWDDTLLENERASNLKKYNELKALRLSELLLLLLRCGSFKRDGGFETHGLVLQPNPRLSLIQTYTRVGVFTVTDLPEGFRDLINQSKKVSEESGSTLDLCHPALEDIVKVVTIV